MPESILHYIWLKGIALSYPQQTTDGKRVEILSVGQHNLDTGPDFSNACIRIYESAEHYQDWVGNVEIHVQSSDWYKHHHETDAAYDSIIMHVVRKADKPVYNSQGQAVPQLELNYPDLEDYVGRYFSESKDMDTAFQTHPCAKQLIHDPSLLTDSWRETMLVRRLDCKTDSIQRLLAISQNDWLQAFYISLAHYFGFHVNGLPFETLAMATPLSVVRKHRDNLFQLEALFLGQSGLLTKDTAQDTAERQLYQEYLYIQHLHGLKPIDAKLWKKARMRPQSQPEVRIRQFAALLHADEFLLSKLLEIREVDAMRALFAPTRMGKASVDILLINVAVPFLYAQGRKEAALWLLQNLPAEDNRIIRQWRLLGQDVQNAADSQALIHLYQTCCEPEKCMDCSVFISLTH